MSALGHPELVRAEGVEPPHLAILEPKSSASTSSATRAALEGRAPITGMRRGATRQPLAGGGVALAKETLMQQIPPFPDNPAEPPTTPHPAQPGQPTEPPPETPPQGPDIDVPTPSPPGTAPSPGPISPVG